MTWEELKIATLQKMFAITGNTVEVDDTTEPYIKSMPHAANEGIDLIVQSGRPVRAMAQIHQMETLPDEDELEAADGYGTVREAGVNRYDLQELFGTTFRRLDESNVRRVDEEGNDAPTRRFEVEAGRYLLLPATLSGDWRVWAICIPEAITLTEDTADDYELPLSKECCDLLPLYMASQLYKDDDIGMATIWHNEFNVALEAIAAQEQLAGGSSCGSFESEYGWY